jgi:hypothetical protein
MAKSPPSSAPLVAGTRGRCERCPAFGTPSAAVDTSCKSQKGVGGGGSSGKHSVLGEGHTPTCASPANTLHTHTRTRTHAHTHTRTHAHTHTHRSSIRLGPHLELPIGWHKGHHLLPLKQAVAHTGVERHVLHCPGVGKDLGPINHGSTRTRRRHVEHTERTRHTKTNALRKGPPRTSTTSPPPHPLPHPT